MDWKDRLREELDELTIRLKKLQDFIDYADQFSELPEIDQLALKMQASAMSSYRDVLVYRIKRIIDEDETLTVSWQRYKK